MTLPSPLASSPMRLGLSSKLEGCNLCSTFSSLFQVAMSSKSFTLRSAKKTWIKWHPFSLQMDILPYMVSNMTQFIIHGLNIDGIYKAYSSSYSSSQVHGSTRYAEICLQPMGAVPMPEWVDACRRLWSSGKFDGERGPLLLGWSSLSLEDSTLWKE
ncbi:hypothetical protein HGM15179_020446 [Zosterops borbonicus]|uniref:Uncharacterized protein n=1 Tax=Zosterops borbonicus TaxID=364589 RepID=A0A8K1DA87_9PASS|nr:hypothetical protein HGM15179_020446 [Zosterops borbonicus]